MGGRAGKPLGLGSSRVLTSEKREERKGSLVRQDDGTQAVAGARWLYFPLPLASCSKMLTPGKRPGGMSPGVGKGLVCCLAELVWLGLPSIRQKVGFRVHSDAGL